MRRFTVASDYLLLTNKVKDSDLDISPTGAMVHGTKNWAPKFESCTFIHVNHSCNDTTHILC